MKEDNIRLYLEKLRAQGSMYVSPDMLPREALDIFIAREDPAFYRHQGVRPKAILSAVKYAIRTGKRLPGGSTITQQLVKNLYLTPERSLLRKAREMVIALRIESRGLLTKAEILELYLNCVRYGPDVFGIADAAEFYFGKTPETLTRNQAVILATAAISPVRRRPIEVPFFFARYRNESLYELVSVGAMTPLEAKSLAHVYQPSICLDPELRTLQDIFGVQKEPKTGDGLVRYAKAQVGSPFWRGTHGQTATLGLLNNSRWNWPDEFVGTDFLDDLGKRVFDDAGLVKGYLWSSGKNARPRYDQKRDWNSAAIYENARRRGPIDSFDRENGRLLYAGPSPEKITHVGIYSSDGLVYHGKDRICGVVEEPFRKSDWTFWSDLPEYEPKPFPDAVPAVENSPLASYIALSPNRTEPRSHPITKITPHYMAGDLSVEACGAMFARAACEASSNYGIGSDGRVGLYVEEKNRSWASASPWNDNRAVTIKCANLPDGSLTEDCWNRLVELCADICRRNGITDCTYTGDSDGVLTMHRWFHDTECPGPWLSGQFERLSREVNSRLNRQNGKDTPYVEIK